MTLTPSTFDATLIRSSARYKNKSEAEKTLHTVFDGKLELTAEEFEQLLISLVSFGVSLDRGYIDQIIGLRIYQLSSPLYRESVEHILSREDFAEEIDASIRDEIEKFATIREHWWVSQEEE